MPVPDSRTADERADRLYVTCAYRFVLIRQKTRLTEGLFNSIPTPFLNGPQAASTRDECRSDLSQVRG